MSSGKRKKHSKARNLLIVIWLIFILAIGGFGYVVYRQRSELSKDLGITSKFTYETNADPNINALVISYLNALASADQASLQACVTDPSQFDNMASVQSRAKVIHGYSSVNCYSVPGMSENEWVVYAVANVSIANVNSQPLDMIPELYIVNQNGKYLIDNTLHSEELKKYIDRVNQEEDIQNLYRMVEEDENEKAEQDPALKEFLSRLSGGSSSGTDAE